MAARFHPSYARIPLVAVVFGGLVLAACSSTDHGASGSPRLASGPASPAASRAAAVRSAPAAPHRPVHRNPPPCPRVHPPRAPWVPAQPPGVDRHSRLVPRQAPAAAVVCRYLPAARYRLSGVRPIRAGLDRLGRDLTWMPRDLLRTGQHICTLAYKPPDHYLIRLTYRNGTSLWVSATDDINDCTDTSNGDFRSWNEPSPQLRAAFASGRWPRQPAPVCDGNGTGRRGQERAMVPAGSTAVRICGPGGRSRRFTSGYDPLVHALDRLPGRPWGLVCRPTHEQKPDPSYDLLFSYPQGPDVVVSVVGWCRPQINNQSLQSQSAATVLPIIDRLLARGGTS